MDQVAAKQDPVLARVENVGHVARRVPRHRKRRQMIVQPIAVPDRSKQVSKALQVRLIDKTRDGIVRDHDPVQVGKRLPTVARYEPVQMVEMRMGESDCADRGWIYTRFGHRPVEMAKRWLPLSSGAAIDQDSLASGPLQQEAIDRQSNQ
ncbi:hypothetical protein RSO01_21810 [Reyranella soli]|uniref:Uncharacterized protein n=1 Tax=Reyranella soli TaxID=1230389 RepID=A0A512N7R3_9HYPH|nr:hypothetical protein RSO01_21810 [Reyranella soli]